MSDVRTLIANLNRQAAESLAKAARELGDKITWRPLDKGRSALDQVIECGGINLLGARVFENHDTAPTVDWDAMEKMRAEYQDPEKALDLLATATDRLARAIEAFPAEQLGEQVTLPFGGGMQKSFAEVALLNHWNMVYHEGQVNYIQTLCAE